MLGEKLVAAPDGVQHLAVRRQSLPPWIGRQTLGDGSNQRKCKQGDQNSFSLLDQERISGLLAKTQVKSQQAVYDGAKIITVGGLLHFGQGGVHVVHGQVQSRGEARGQALQNGANLIHVHHILLAEADDARAAPVSLLDQPLGDQHVQSLADGSLGNAELAGPGPFHYSLAWRNSAAQDLFAKLLSEALFDE